jgi:hypothetical protein
MKKSGVLFGLFLLVPTAQATAETLLERGTYWSPFNERVRLQNSLLGARAKLA